MALGSPPPYEKNTTSDLYIDIPHIKYKTKSSPGPPPKQIGVEEIIYMYIYICDDVNNHKITGSTTDNCVGFQNHEFSHSSQQAYVGINKER